LALEQGGGAAAEGVSLKHAPLRFIVQSGWKIKCIENN
jgi:hypothetical protein